MGKYAFKKNDAGIRNLLKSQECLTVMESEARKIADGGEMTPFVGFDRAKVFIERQERKND